MICFAWSGFPQYAARCIRAFVRSTQERVVVLGTRPSVPIVGMELLCGCEVKWVERDQSFSVQETLGEVPRLLILSGWHVPTFNRLCDEVRRTGGRAICMCDNNFSFSLMECLKSLRFRMLYRRKYDGFFVPGKSGLRLLEFYGVATDRIETGMYSADATLFKDGRSLATRQKTMLFVGRYIKRKNVLRLVQAFLQANTNDEWTLDLYGSGVLKSELLTLSASHVGVHVHDFLQPEALSEKLREARVFCLPSLREHWGVVVHEAALSGCYLLLGNQTGAAEDMLADKSGEENAKSEVREFANGMTFPPTNTRAFTEAIKRAMRLSDARLVEAQQASIAQAQTISVEKFAEAVARMAAVKTC